jgi:hypothetical protein
METDVPFRRLWPCSQPHGSEHAPVDAARLVMPTPMLSEGDITFVPFDRLPSEAIGLT